jgi:hypothetical protein
MLGGDSRRARIARLSITRRKESWLHCQHFEVRQSRRMDVALRGATPFVALWRNEAEGAGDVSCVGQTIAV